MYRWILFSSSALFLLSCAEIEPQPFIPSAGHVNVEPEQQQTPDLLSSVPLLPAPELSPIELEKYTVVVNQVPVKEFLFALARDSEFNIDIDPAISGVVTLNAIEQTLPQILNRVSRQVALTYEFTNNSLFIQPDQAFLRIYTIDYVNLSRHSSSHSSISTQITSTSSGSLALTNAGNGNNSTTDVKTQSQHHFWARLVSNIAAILGESISAVSGDQIPLTASVIPNPESSLISIIATASQHKQIKYLIDLAMANVKRQVVIQITIVEVTLNKHYQAGIDWSFLDRDGDLGIDIISTALPGTQFATGTSSSFVIQDREPDSNDRNGNLMATVKLLDEFGDTKILSSPQLMVLNNQTALLKVVENIVYFEVDSETIVATATTSGRISADTTAKTVPVGIVMVITPQIDINGMITLNVRPTISRLINFVNDPNPELARADIENPVPQIAVREMESVLRLVDGQIGVLGGLMTNETRDRNVGLPGLKDIGLLGWLFQSKSAQYSKTELVVFLRPTIIHNPSVNGSLNSYRRYLNTHDHTVLETQ